MSSNQDPITPQKQAPSQPQLSAKSTAIKKKSIANSDRLSTQGRKSQKSIHEEVSSPNQQRYNTEYKPQRSSIGVKQQSPKLQTPVLNSKSRGSRLIENHTGQDKPTFARQSAPQTPKEAKTITMTNKSNTRNKSSKKNNDNQKTDVRKSRSAKRRINLTDVDETKKKKVFALNNEVINIMVPKYTTKNKFSDEAVIQADGGKIELWTAKQENNNISFVESDVADEFEYKYDPNYLSPTRNTRSPNVRMNLSVHKKKGRPQSTTPTIVKKQKNLLNDLTPEKYLQSATEDGLGESNNFIKRTCKEISSARPQRIHKGKKNFINRMIFDITKRNTRDKTFDTIKDVIHLKVGLQLDTSRSMSPNSKGHKHDEVNSHRQSSSTNLLSPKKFTPKQRDGFINRMMEYEERKQKAINMLQEAQRQEEIAEYLQAVKNSKIHMQQFAGKLTQKEKQSCYERLITDAEKRKQNEIQVKRQMQIQADEEAKILFKPKINNYSKDNQKQMRKSIKETSSQKIIDTEVSHNPSEQQALTLEQKIQLFQKEAHSNSRASSKMNSARVQNDEHMNIEVNDQMSLDGDEEGQIAIIQTMKQ